MSVMTVGWVESDPVEDQIASDSLPPSCTVPESAGRPPDGVGLGEVWAFVGFDRPELPYSSGDCVC